MANDLSSGSLLQLAKERYADVWEELVYAKDPFLAEVPKKQGTIDGKYIVQPIVYGHNQAVSANIATAVGASANATERPAAFQISRVKLYNVAKIDGETMAALHGGSSSFVDAVTQVLDGATVATAEMLGQQLMRTGWGTKGVVGSISGSTITLTNPEDIWGWERDQQVVFSSTEATAVLRGTGGGSAQVLRVASVDRNNGIITFTAAVSTVTGGGGVVAAGDFCFDFGNRQDSATPTPLVVAGTGGWVPQANPASTAWFGVDRTQDTRLGGLRYDARGKPIEEALINALAYAYRENARPDRLYLNPTDYANLINALGSRAVYVDLSAKDAAVGFKGVVINGAGGQVVVMANPSTPVGTGFALTLNTWTLHHLKELIHIYEDDGREFIRDISGPSDAVSVWFRFMGNLGCSGPSLNMNIRLA